MIGKKALVAAAIGAVAVLVTTSTAWSGWGFDRSRKGGFVKPCSLDGVNPVYHPDIFGNPAFARAYYGFVRGRDGNWYVEPGCNIPL
ncbi:MAG TPA: hypothetical protein VIY51_24845 [Xanthobacteraceae bacterium]